MSDQTFNSGDIVKLKSGGPKMTVQRLVGDKSSPIAAYADAAIKTKGFKDGDVICQWFNKDDELKSDVFHVETLMLASRESF